MRFVSTALMAFGVSAMLLVGAASGTTTTKKKSSHKTSGNPAAPHTSKAHAKEARKVGSTAHAKSAHSRSRHRRATKASWKSRGQHGIDSDRTRQIQEALIREKYLSGEADGNWDARTQDAMRRYQQDHGWQSKVLPDSRALIKLGLGPDHTQVLNPETAAVSPYATSSAASATGTVMPAAETSVPATPAVRNQN
ncbi:MAG TPA: peptidoglycan-binding domain-containing protein [Terriglobales bacterium]|nr:peptidoglycan-binding domain-containing protein [Terriglobales bacterium]